MPISNIVRSAVAGMLSHKLNLDTIANNLANVNTTGFKAGRVHFQDVLYENYTYATNAEEVRVGAGVRPSAISPTYTQGSLEQTDIPTDVAIYGEGFFQVRQNDGTFAYTRNGNFRLDIVDGQRVLVNTDGLPVMGPNAGPVVIGPEASAQSLTISSNPSGLTNFASATCPIVLMTSWPTSSSK
ncbi:MAG: flagellar hook-basal body protein, partial [Chloroflexi bacterium]|nr:flagellar hook-basal body protein [Chloroflexota bacterium]